jgi:hypothetical protein
MITTTARLPPGLYSPNGLPTEPLAPLGRKKPAGTRPTVVRGGSGGGASYHRLLLLDKEKLSEQIILASFKLSLRFWGYPTSSIG